MEKNTPKAEISSKSTKEQILSAYNKALSQLEEKHVASPIQEKHVKEKEETIVKAAGSSVDIILNDLNNVKSKTIKQIDNLSEELITEFDKLSNLQEAIDIEQKHLQELYKINEVADTLAALLQTQATEEQSFKIEMDSLKQTLAAEIAQQKADWSGRKEQLEKEYKERHAELEKDRIREEEAYAYKLELERRKEMDEYVSRKSSMERAVEESTENLNKREEDILIREQEYNNLKQRVELLPAEINQAVDEAKEKLSNELSEKYNFEKQLSQKDYEATVALKEQIIKHLEGKVVQQESYIRELTIKNDLASEQVQSIACKALDTSAQRFTPTTISGDREKGN